MLECYVSGCGKKCRSLSSLKRHYSDSHSGELWPDDDDLPDDNSEQRDFNGEEPDDSDHNPEYETENNPPDTATKPLNKFSEGDSGE
jgi:hypothetical protein